MTTTGTLRLWKEVDIFKTLEKVRGAVALNTYHLLISKMHVKALEMKDSTLVLQIAMDLSISYYDASFVSLCTIPGVRLITDDLRLTEMIERSQEYFKSRFNAIESILRSRALRKGLINSGEFTNGTCLSSLAV